MTPWRGAAAPSEPPLLCGTGLHPDPAQIRAAEALERLLRRLKETPPARGGWQDWRRRKALQALCGIYLHGGVGRGKTMLMDLFHARAARLQAWRARRTHFHAFMANVHSRLHEWRMQSRAGRSRVAADPIPPLAGALAEEARLLCFDEFDVRDITDAMILARLFETLLDFGVVVVTTSNRAPQALYADGLQRDRFLPFIALVERRFEVLHLDGKVDYRLRNLGRAPVYFSPLGAAAAQALDDTFSRLAGGADAVPETLQVQGRLLRVPAANGGIARFGFDDLCVKPLGTADYLAIAERFHTVILAGVPKLAPEHRDEARRFANLVDILYDKHVKLMVSADAPPDALYPAGTGAFEFRRAASRLVEMQTAAYLALPHTGRTPLI